MTVSSLLEGHVGLGLECLDRIYLNGYVPNLQVSGQVVSFITHHLGHQIASPEVLEKIGKRFRAEVCGFAAECGVKWSPCVLTEATAISPFGVSARSSRLCPAASSARKNGSPAR